MSSQCTAIPSPGCRSAEMVYHDRVAEMADILRESGSGVQLWLNEMGYADYRYSDKLASLSGIQVQYNYEHTPQYAAAALLKAEIMALASGAVAVTGWYRIDDFSLGEALRRRRGELSSRPHRDFRTQGAPFCGPEVLQQAVPVVPLASGRIPPGLRPMGRRWCILEARGGKLMIAGCLRSSEDTEVSPCRRCLPLHGSACCTLQSGVACARLRRTRPQSKDEAHVFSRTLYGAALSGEHVFVAEMNCSRN